MSDPARAPALDGDDVRSMLQRYDRTPFIDVLQTWLAHAPTGEAIHAMSQRNPSLWAQSIIGLAKMAGFTEKRELAVTVADLRTMSDSQLEAALLEKAHKLGIAHQPMVEDAVVVPEPVKADTKANKKEGP